MFCLALMFVGLSAVAQATPELPTFSSRYRVDGFIILPYANLKEPFSAYMNEDLKKSRIDYYNGEMSTYQIATKYVDTPESGANFKVVWVPNNMTHRPEKRCFQVNNTAEAPVKIQSAFPDMTNFTYAGEELCSTGSASPSSVVKGNCSKWRNVVVNYDRKNTNTIWTQKKADGTHVPVRYVMYGYDSLFGSHYDIYEMIYTRYEVLDDSTTYFDVYAQNKGIVCTGFPEGSGVSRNHLLNPMKEFIDHDESHLHEQFDEFKTKYGKSYVDAHEAHRKNKFRQNQRYINSMNRKNRHFKLAINHLADMDQDELRYLRGKLSTSEKNDGKQFDASRFSNELPRQIDWRQKGIVSPVKDQAICGSCWSFGTTGHLEAMYAIKFNKTINLAEQQLVDCSWQYGNNACDGGEDFRAYGYITDYGLGTVDEYGAYRGIDGKCHDRKDVTIKTLNGYVNVVGIENLKKAINYIGPISVGIDAGHLSFVFYHEGVFYEKDCGNKPENLDHAVLAVGYGVENGEEYWLIKNSWSTHWGDEGYVKMKIGDNMCGVATAATYAILPDN